MKLEEIEIKNLEEKIKGLTELYSKSLNIYFPAVTDQVRRGGGGYTSVSDPIIVESCAKEWSDGRGCDVYLVEDLDKWEEVLDEASEIIKKQDEIQAHNMKHPDPMTRLYYIHQYNKK